jgi:hypothetical protein
MDANQTKLITEVIGTCKALHSYHDQVAYSYQEITTYLEGVLDQNVTQLTGEQAKTIVDLISLPIVGLFKSMEQDKPGSPEYIYKLICHCYTTYNDK